MNVAAMFALLAFAIGLWWLLLQKLRAKPWLYAGIAHESARDPANYPAKVIGLGVFLAVVTALFSLFAAAYHMRMAVPDWTHLPLPRLLWANTALLALSGIALQWAWSRADRFAASADRADLNATRQGLMAGGCFALAFLAGQWLAWRQLDASGFYFSCTPASAFFYLLTGLHALHLLGGLWVWSGTAIAMYRADFAQSADFSQRVNFSQNTGEPSATLLNVKLCAIYWHYLLLIWIGVYALLLFT